MNQATKEVPGDIAVIAKLMILLAWEAGELSEGQAVRALQMPRVAARELRARMIACGVKAAELLGEV